MATKERYTVVSTMKNEGPYILEWVAHYKALGFDEIVVCTNDCEDTTVEILKHLEGLGLVHHHATQIRKGGIHRSALRQAARMDVVKGSDWIFVCDVDEFLTVKEGDGSARALVALSGEEADVIAVPWRVFGPNGISLFRDRFVTEQFTRAEAPGENPQAGKFVKSLFRRPDLFRRFGLHLPVAREEGPVPRIVWPGGALHVENGRPTGTPPPFHIAQVNHYALRSMEAFLIKRARGRANHMHHVLGMEYWERFDFGGEEDLSIRRYDPLRDQWMQSFREDEKLWTLHRKSVRWHRWKARELRKDPAANALRLEILARFAAGRSEAG